jgi:tetratricopeptide (TPR) repeat protein
MELEQMIVLMKAKTKTHAFIICLLAIVLAGCGGAVAELGIGELLDLGHKYLLDENYEEAILTFEKAIVIEARNPLGYIGAAIADMGLEKPEDAVAMLERGLETIESEDEDGGADARDISEGTAFKGINYIIDLIELIKSGEYNFDIAEQIWRDAYAAWISGVETVPDDRNSGGLTSEQSDLLNELMRALTNDEYVIAAGIVSGELYKLLVEQSAEEDKVVYEGENTSLVIYPGGHVYCGDFADDIRNGSGIWFDGNSDAAQYRYYEGQWFNDLPNGKGSVFEVIDETHLEKEEGYTYAIYTKSEGMFKNGAYDGTFSITWNMDSGEIHHWTPMYNEGVSQAMQDASTSDYGSYDIALCDNCGAILSDSENFLNYIFGFSD